MADISAFAKELKMPKWLKDLGKWVISPYADLNANMGLRVTASYAGEKIGISTEADMTIVIFMNVENGKYVGFVQFRCAFYRRFAMNL